MRNTNLHIQLLVTTIFMSCQALSAQAAPIFNGVAAGDTSSSDAILWTRADNGGATTALTAQVSTDQTFATGVTSFSGTTSASSDYTLKLNATGLNANTRYYYRFVDSNSGAVSSTGSFATAAAANQATEVRLGFSGDADGRFRPFSLVNGFGTSAQPQSQNLNFFVFLGDTFYETASRGSPAVPALTGTSTAALINAAVPVYQRKNLETLTGVNTASGAINTASGQQGLQNLLAATGSYTVLDNHELGNRALQSGGAPVAVGGNGRVGPADGFDVNTTGSYDNQTTAYKAIEKVFFDYHATKAGYDATLTSNGRTVNAPGDARSNGTPQQYFAQQQGKNAIYIQLDDRTYRDARLGLTTGGADDVTSDRRNNPNRTQLGSTQLAWFEQQLLDAQAAGTPWKIVSVSTPIDQRANNSAFGIGVDGKSWYGGYNAERNELLKFIADNHISNVVFLTTDDHETRTTALTYLRDINDPSSVAAVPGAFQIVTGPIGAGGPDGFTDHSISTLQSYTDQVNNDLRNSGAPLIGLCGFDGLSNVHREGVSSTDCSSLDFYSPDTFSYSILDISADGSSLNVETYGIDSYQQNTYPQDAPLPRNILGFTLAAGFVANIPEPGNITIIGLALTALLVRRRRRD